MMNWSTRWGTFSSMLALAAVVALPLSTDAQQQPSQANPNPSAAASDQQAAEDKPTADAAEKDKQSKKEKKDKQAAEKDKQAKQDKQADTRKLQVFQLKHRDPQHLIQILTLSEQAAEQGKLNFNASGQLLNTAMTGRIATGYRGTAQADADQADRMVTAADAEKKILFVRGTSEQLDSIKKLVEAFDVEDQQLKQQHTFGTLRLIPVANNASSQVRSTLTQLDLAGGMLQMGQTTLIVFHEDENNRDRIEQAEQVINAYLQDKEDKQAPSDKPADKPRADRSDSPDAGAQNRGNQRDRRNGNQRDQNSGDQRNQSSSGQPNQGSGASDI